MDLHTVKESESIEDIARLYETSEERIKINNGIEKSVPKGRELLILKPTRSYRPMPTDTLRSVGRRFGVKTSELRLYNPFIGSESLDGKEIAVKYPTPRGGTAAVLGYFYPSTPLARLEALMPFFSYVAISEYCLTPHGLKRLFDAREAKRTVCRERCVMLLRVNDRTDGAFLNSEASLKEASEELLGAAIAGGYKGVLFSAIGAAKKNGAAFARFIVETRRAMIGCDQMLFVECDENTGCESSELADGGIFIYSKLPNSKELGFGVGEKHALSEFAENADSSKMLVDLPSLVYTKEGCMGLRELWESGTVKEIVTDTDALVSYTDTDACFESLGNIKARLELISELGFMGVSVDIGRIGIEYLMMTYAAVRPVHLYSPFSLPI